MRFLGRCSTHAFYPVQSRDEAVTVVQKDLFVYSNGVAGSAIYLSVTKDAGFEVAPWVVECEICFDNLAEISVNKGEFDELFGIPYDELRVSWDVFNEQQRKIIIWAGYDGFLIDKTLLAVYGNMLRLHAIKAFPKVNDPDRSSSYNTIWKKIKRISGVFNKGTQNG
jgi:hypothetical protein